jgi:hypothetical protein
MKAIFPLALLALAALVGAAGDDGTFQTFFPQYNKAFRHILDSKCSDVLSYYRHAKSLEELGQDPDVPKGRGNWSVVELAKDFGYNAPENFVVECVLGNTPEIIKSKMATSQVLLGLTPSLLSLLAPGLHQTGLIAVASGNPLLAILLAGASPTVYPLLSLDYTKSVEVITTRRLEVPDFCRSNGMLILAVEYLVVLGCIANIIEVSLRLFQQASFAFHLGAAWFIFLWFFMGIVLHGLGAVTVATRVKVVPETTDVEHGRFMVFVRKFHVFRRAKSLRLRVVRESFQFYAISWVASVITVSHLFYGSMMFSSVLFVSVEDSAIILARLMLSVVVSKLVIMYELFYLQGVVSVTEEPGDIGPKSTLEDSPSREQWRDQEPGMRRKW